MSTESVVIDETGLVNQDEDETSHDLDNFDYTKYTQYFPDEVKDALTASLQEQKRGWKFQARTLKRIEHWSKIIEGNKADLVEMLTGRRTRNPFLDARSRLRTVISALDNDRLEQLAVKNDVSYSSFMNTNDKHGLVEAIVDEMLRDLVPA